MVGGNIPQWGSQRGSNTPKERKNHQGSWGAPTTGGQNQQGSWGAPTTGEESQQSGWGAPQERLNSVSQVPQRAPQGVWAVPQVGQPNSGVPQGVGKVPPAPIRETQVPPVPLRPAQSTQVPQYLHPGIPATAVATKSNKRLLVILSVVCAILVTALIAGILLQGSSKSGGGLTFTSLSTKKPSGTMSMEEAYGTMFTEEFYDLQEPLIDVPNDYSFQMPLTIEAAEKLEGTVEAGDDCSFACVYGDPSLEMPLPQLHTYLGGDKQYIDISGMAKPDASTGDARRDSDGNFNLGWSGYEGYWYVEKRDKNANKLKKPKITYFTVKDKNRSSISRPKNLKLTAEDGVLRISWDKVEGAKKYRIYTATYNKFFGDIRHQELVDTDKTSIRLDEFNDLEECGAYGQKECVKDPEERVYQPNIQIDGIVQKSEDDVMRCEAKQGKDNSCTNTHLALKLGDGNYDEYMKTFNPDMDVDRMWVYVTTIDNDGKESYISVQPLSKVAGDLIAKEAFYASNEVDNARGWGKAWGELPDKVRKANAKYYVTMLDGTTKEFYKVCDQETLNSNRTVTCKVPGTPFTDDRIFKDQSEYDLYKTQIATWKKESQNAGAVVPTFKENFDKLKESDSQPIGKNGVEKYKPFGSTDYTRYVAENLLAMRESIDVTEYANSPSAPEFGDVFNEVIMQNSYLYVMSKLDGTGIRMSVSDIGGKTILNVSYSDDAEQLRDEFYNAVTNAAKTITAGATYDGAVQIDNYLASVAEYDHPAFNAHEDGASREELVKNYPGAWGGGVLLNGKGVCVSYALCFDAIADQVGLTSLLVSGNGDTGAHAWNRVNIDNQWLDIDPTWDDKGSVAVADYQLKPANTLDRHTVVAASWILEANASRFGGSNR